MPADTADNAITPLENGGYEVLVERRSEGLLHRFFVTLINSSGLLFGAAYTYVQDQKQKGNKWGLIVLTLRLFLLLAWLFLDRDLVKKPFPVQFRIRLERMGPTYIKLGQILSLRDDLLPKSITDELKNLLDRLPAVPFPRYKKIIEETLQRPISLMFPWIDPIPLGSASLGQTHRARLITGEDVVIKVLKPNVRQMVKNDLRWLRLVGRIAQIFLTRYQPKRLIDEFSRYTLLETDLRNEANNAEIFAVNFQDEPDIHFPKIYLSYSNEDVLTMEFFEGAKPDTALVARLSQAELDKVIGLGTKATVQMIFRDGFFHADLHPGNMIIFDDASLGFIDLGMAGRFDSGMQKMMLYYFYSLTTGDAANAARYLTAMTIPGRGADPDGFRRSVEDMNRRWLRSPNFDEFSIGQLILESISLAGRFHIQYPGEIVLMVKTLVTLEGVANVLTPGIDITQVARKDVQDIMLQQFNVRKLVKNSMLILPEIFDILNRSPLVINEGLRFMENQLKSKREGPLDSLRGVIFGSFLVLAGAIVIAADGSPFIWGFLLFTGFSIAGYGMFFNR
ncbi:MAG TPA: AarF/ABC1/UbiB kinase family protein [Anaerolineae bacterium]|nr:AarF/ABC1/UbiB kinase family protein [Anaerolineae bacterium]HIP73049.1 AarF/ABC1/UbiB kinase family protein [Anaerolineae bacterium]